MPKIVSENGTMRARLITPGQGSSGYYSPALLEKSATKFDGAQVFWDHPTSTEESTRPERSLRDLAGKITPGTAKWEAAGKEGAGIYADVEVFKPYREAVNEIGPHIGMSIRASGQGKSGTVNGKNTMVIESLDAIQSVDFVTLAGRGGKPLQMFEAARAAGRAAHNPNPQQEQGMTEQEQTQLREATASNARLLKRAIRGDARELAVAVLAGLSLQEAAKTRVVETCLANVPEKDGDLDRAAFTEAVKAEAAREGAYVASIAGTGRVTGMGAAASHQELTEAQRTEADAKRKREESEAVTLFESLGLTKEAAALAAKGRAA